jgi:hypothetical protein
LLDWLGEHSKYLQEKHLQVELAGAITRLFCLPFSPAMDSPMTIRRMAQAYASSALGAAAPLHYEVAEPLAYGQAPVILGLNQRAGNWSAVKHKRLRGVASYALAMWNRHAHLLPDENCWLVVVEPSSLTFFFKQGTAIGEILVRPRSDESGDQARNIQRLIKQQFHRRSSGLYLLDEFALLADTSAEMLRLPLAVPSISLPSAENTL